MRKLLIIGYVWPESRSSAAGGRMMELIALFHQQGWQITFASAAQLSDHMDDLTPYNVDIQQIALNCSSFDSFVENLMPDMVLFDRFMIEEQFGWRVEQQCPTAIRLLESSDLHCLRDARHKAQKQQRQLDDFDLNSDIAKREIAAIYRSDLTLIISDYELSLLTEHYRIPSSQLFHLPFMLDLQHYNTGLSFEERQHFITIGNFRHAPNWDSVYYLKTEIWPKIRKQIPKAELHIYGAYPPPKATQLHNPKQGFLVKGWAEEVHEVMRTARICLSPLRFGAGIKGKFADAMLNGTPSITTSVGAESMHGDLPWPGVIADSPDEIVDAAVALYNDAESWQRAQTDGHTILKQRFDASKIQPELINTITALSQHLEQHRASNFTGQMLRFHNNRSTQFMSQWIEAKNKLENYS